MKKAEKTFWVTNISNRNVSLTDLNITIKSMSIANLLGKKYELTEEQVEKSYTLGSLFQKRHMIIKRIVEPVIDDGKLQNTDFAKYKNNKVIEDRHSAIPGRQRSIVEAKVKEYEELKVTSDQDKSRQEEFDEIAENIENTESNSDKVKGS